MFQAHKTFEGRASRYRKMFITAVVTLRWYICVRLMENKISPMNIHKEKLFVLFAAYIFVSESKNYFLILCIDYTLIFSISEWWKNDNNNNNKNAKHIAWCLDDRIENEKVTVLYYCAREKLFSVSTINTLSRSIRKIQSLSTSITYKAHTHTHTVGGPGV